MTVIKKEGFGTPRRSRNFLELLGFILYQHFFSYLSWSRAMYTIPSWYADGAQAAAWIERFLIMESRTMRQDARSKAMQFAGGGRLLYAKKLDSWIRFLGDEDMAIDMYYALQSIILDPKKREKAEIPEPITKRITEDRVILLHSQVERLLSMIPKELSLSQKFHLMLLLSLIVSIPLTIDVLLNRYCYTGDGTFSNLWFFTLPTALTIILAYVPTETLANETQEIETKKTFVETLPLYGGRVSDAGFWKTAIKPIPLIVYPAVTVSTFVYASFQTWLMSFSLLSVKIFSAPPYNLSSSQIGLTNLPQFSMEIAATMLAGWTADKIAACMSRHNNGAYEPELRLTLMIPAVVLSTIGLFGFDISVERGLPIYWPVAFTTINSLAVPFATSASFTYVIDCHPRDANQAFLTINFVKAIMVFVSSSCMNGWLEMAGAKRVFITIGLINAGICMLALPIYVYGKRLRSLIARSSLAKKL